jgi:hypothetical protein
MRHFTKADIDSTLAYSIWDLGNQVLYNMCRTHPRHKEEDEIVAKVWLIGRSYAASIERRRNAKDKGDDFYETVVAPTMRKHPIDSWLRLIKSTGKPGSAQTVSVHKRLMNLFHSITGLEKRSLASKYLHFHKPDAFFIYDSRVRQSITKVVPRLNEIPKLDVDEFDVEYRDFVRRCVWLRTHIQETLGTVLTPRQIDKLLLTQTDRFRKPRRGDSFWPGAESPRKTGSYTNDPRRGDRTDVRFSQ